MAKQVADVPPDKLALYEKVVATAPGIPRRGAKNPYTSLNGHMFSFLTKDGKMALRLGKEAREAFVSKHKTPPVVVYETVMKEYVQIPDAMLKNTAVMKRHFAASVAYIETLEPKATTRKKTAKKKTARKKTARRKTAKKNVSKKTGTTAAARKSTKKKAGKKKSTTKKTARKKAGKKR